MIVLKTASQPLDFAYLAAKRMFWGNEQATCLRKMAAGFGAAVSTPVETCRSLSLLAEARTIMRSDSDSRLFDYPRLAIDFVNIGYRDLAHEVIEDSIRFAAGKSTIDRTVLLIHTAKACLDSGENETGLRILPGMNHLMRAARLLEWDAGPFSLFLRLGMVREAAVIAKQMDARNRACAFTEIAFHAHTPETHKKTFLNRALILAERSHYVTDDIDIFDWAKAHIATRLAEKRHYEKALNVAKQIQNQACCLTVLTAFAHRMLGNAMNEEAMQIIEIVRSVCRKQQDVESVEYVRSPQTRDFQQKLILDEGLLSLVHPLQCAGMESVVRSILDDARTGAERIIDYTTRLENLAKLVRWFAPIDINIAETLIDRVLAAPLADLEPNEDNPSVKYSRIAPAILFRLTTDIFKFSLSWNESRQAQIRKHLVQLPVYLTF
jgi:hypothetical protein